MILNMTRKDFGQYCGLARALDIVGERWALLIVRELLARPARYTDLAASLPGIPTNALTARLKELERAGLVERRLARGQQRAVLYVLTADGVALQDAVLTLAVWGNAHLEERRAGDLVPPSSLAMAMRAFFNPQAVGDLAASWEIHTAGIILRASIRDGQIDSSVGPGEEEPDLVIALRGDDIPSFPEILAAIAEGNVELTGRTELASAFVAAFAPSPDAQ